MPLTLDIELVRSMGFVPLSRAHAGLLFEVFSQRYECGSILVTTILPFDECTGVFGYTAFGIPEYWRFDPSGGRHHGAPLAGDRLAEGTYQPIDILETTPDHLYGHSDALNLDLCREKGKLRWWDPTTRRCLPTFDEESDGRIAEAEARADSAEARVRELESELDRRRGG